MLISYTLTKVARSSLLKSSFCFSTQKKSSSLGPSDFLTSRHIGPDEKEIAEMLQFCGFSNIEGLIKQAIPDSIRDVQALEDGAIGDPIPEHIFLQKMKKILSQNKLYKCYIGGGFSPCLLPTVIQRNLLQNPGWYTAYTPYQAEVSQGRLESLLNYQTMIQELTKMEISNASLLDEASSGGQAMYMSFNVHNGKRKKIFIDSNVFITTQEVVKTKGDYVGIDTIVDDYNLFFTKYKPEQFCGVIVQTPDSRGILHNFSSFFNQISESKSLVTKIVATDLLALTIVTPPGEMGADICFGSSQRFGVPMGYGGPSAAFFASTLELVRRMPGRIIGISKDQDEQMAFRMALQTREQHIRREKATSNICTAQALLANISAMYAIYHNPKGLREIAFRVNELTQILAKVLQFHGYSVVKLNKANCSFFDTVTVENCQAQKIYQQFIKHQINIRKNSDKQVSFSLHEITNLNDLVEISSVLEKLSGKKLGDIKQLVSERLPFEAELVRKENYMQHKIFNSIHSETQMLRYLRTLQQKDVALDRSMISLGSCTMKLNATTQMIPLTWPEMNLHPFVDPKQAVGYHEIINRLKEYLKSVTKFDEICFQPNSGATGQYHGILTLCAYLKSIGQGHRRLCLIPKSAHGTNPASACLAGLTVLPVQVENGAVDMKDFHAKVSKFGKQIAVFMITFPSTAGKYETTVQEMIDAVHKCGGQVYMDGANMNAQTGYTSPGYLGADVCHLNLHKTFAIPHGGGGPGMGPIGVKKHLIPFLPTNHYSVNYKAATQSLGSLATTQYGSASILSISYAYITLLGKQGVRKSTALAILNANYLMARLKPYYQICYNQKATDRCSHEFIIDVGKLKTKTGIKQEDIAKRLIDYGFHAPTMSFPVPGTLMVEPTESEDKGQLDRFADALINIHKEAHECPQIVQNAPYTAECLTKEWPYKFSRTQAVYPLDWVKRRGKYWPPVRRISNPFGDRNLVCSCPEISAYVE